MSPSRPAMLIVLFTALSVIVWSTTLGSRDSTDDSAGSGEWLDRLEALNPADALAYFELAEEVADAAGDQPPHDLAKRLYALAGVLDQPRLGRSACLALALLEDHPQAKRRLLALAGLLDQRGGVGSAHQTNPAGDLDPVAVMAVAEALSHYRKGQGARALAALARPGAMELLEAHGHVLRGGVRGFLEDCRSYRPPRKPALLPNDLMTMLRFEAALLAGPHRSWSSDLLLTNGQPLIEADPDRVADMLGVDASKPYFRHGRWLAHP